MNQKVADDLTNIVTGLGADPSAAMMLADNTPAPARGVHRRTRPPAAEPSTPSTCFGRRRGERRGGGPRPGVARSWLYTQPDLMQRITAPDKPSRSRRERPAPSRGGPGRKPRSAAGEGPLRGDQRLRDQLAHAYGALRTAGRTTTRSLSRRSEQGQGGGRRCWLGRRVGWAEAAGRCRPSVCRWVASPGRRGRRRSVTRRRPGPSRSGPAGPWSAWAGSSTRPGRHRTR